MITAASGFTCPRDRVALETLLGIFRCPVCGELWPAVKRWGRLEPDLSDEEVVVVESCGSSQGPERCQCRRQRGHAGGHYCPGEARLEGDPPHMAHSWGN